MEQLKEFLSLIVLAIVSIVAGLLGLITKHKLDLCNKSVLCKIKTILVGMLGSMLVAWLTFEISLYIGFHERLSIAIGGYAAFIGTDLLVKFEAWIEKLFERKLKDI